MGAEASGRNGVPKQIVWVNGKFLPRSQATVSVFDHGLLYGDGCFEGIKSFDGNIFKLEPHIDRFLESAHFLNIDLGLSHAELCRVVLETVAVNGLHEGIAYIRLVGTRGVGDLGINPLKCRDGASVFCIATTIQIYAEEKYESGIRIATVSTRRNSIMSLPARVKSLNYLNNVLAIIEANRAGAEEGLMLDQAGFVSECTVDNIFFVKQGVIRTPAAHHSILLGITRDSIIDIARRADYAVEEGSYLTFDVYTADECWITGTGADLMPVIEVDGRVIGDGRPGPVFRNLRSRWHDYVKEPGNCTPVPSRESVLAD
jgi:branched-chain amino acid aminotransferase